MEKVSNTPNYQKRHTYIICTLAYKRIKMLMCKITLKPIAIFLHILRLQPPYQPEKEAIEEPLYCMHRYFLQFLSSTFYSHYPLLLFSLNFHYSSLTSNNSNYTQCKGQRYLQLSTCPTKTQDPVTRQPSNVRADY